MEKEESCGQTTLVIFYQDFKYLGKTDLILWITLRGRYSHSLEKDMESLEPAPENAELGKVGTGPVYIPKSLCFLEPYFLPLPGKSQQISLPRAVVCRDIHSLSLLGIRELGVREQGSAQPLILYPMPQKSWGYRHGPP